MKINFKLIPPHSFFAVSAGVDSVACSHFLATRGLLSGILHANNKFTKDDDKMEQAAANLARFLKLPFYFERNYAKLEKGSSEDWCRKLRISFFERWGARWTFRPNILTAHNLNDCTESYLMNAIFQGHGEFKPIPFKTEFVNFSLLRPFLLTDKEEMIKYCKQNNLMQFVIDDPLNHDLTRIRNWIRYDLLPQIYKKVNLKTIVKKKVSSYFGC